MKRFIGLLVVTSSLIPCTIFCGARDFTCLDIQSRKPQPLTRILALRPPQDRTPLSFDVEAARQSLLLGEESLIVSHRPSHKILYGCLFFQIATVGSVVYYYTWGHQAQ